MNTIKRFWKDETGMELSEYAVVGSMIALAIIAVFTDLGNAIGGKIKDLAISGVSGGETGLSTGVEE
ncbi:MAG: Flp family type IVb pilin [Blastocatellales bacterium]